MQITQVMVGNNLYPLVEGQLLSVNVGETIRVFYSFKYKLPEKSDVEVWASLYGITRIESAQTKREIVLEKSLVWKDYEGTIDIIIGSISSGVYGLICELPGREDAEGNKAEHLIENCISVTAPPSIWGMIPMLIMMMVMGMMMNMMTGVTEEL